MKPIYIASFPILASQHGWPCQVRCPSRKHLFQIPWANGNSSLETFYINHQSHYYDAEYVGSIPNALVVGPGVLVTPDGLAIFRDLSTSFNVARDQHWLLSTHYPSFPIEIVKKNIWLVATLGGNSYYHWLLEEVPRLVTAILKGAQCVYTSKFCSNLSFILEAFNYSGQLIFPSAELKALRFENVHCQSLHGESGNVSPELPALMRRIGDVLINHISLSPASPERIFISRRSKRRLLNENEIYDQYLERLGFVRILLEDFSFADQIHLFRNASIVIGIHGAGLANIVFMRQKSIFIELLNSDYMHWCYWQLAIHCNLDYYPVADSSSHTFTHGLTAGDLDFKLPLEPLVDIITKLGIG